MFTYHDDDTSYKFYFRHDTKVKHTLCFCEVTKENGTKEMSELIGSATCSKSDNFDRSKGRKISLARLLDRLGFTREERVKIWEEYFKHTKKK